MSETLALESMDEQFNDIVRENNLEQIEVADAVGDIAVSAASIVPFGRQLMEDIPESAAPDVASPMATMPTGRVTKTGAANDDTVITDKD
jgi:hypothetical protein